MMPTRAISLEPIREWGYLTIGDRPGKHQVTHAEAEALLDAAAAHPLAKEDGTNILARDRRSRLRAQQMVGVLSAKGCSLEILPKIDPDLPDANGDVGSLRRNLVGMLDVAHELDISVGANDAMAYGANGLLEIFILSFAKKLLKQARRGLPIAYVPHAEDLPKLRGRLDVVRQFTRHAVRPDRLACRFDEMTSDIALLQIMKATVLFLDRYSRSAKTRRLLAELRFLFADISDVPVTRELWRKVKIDRTNLRWQRLFDLAAMLLQREWQSTHGAAQAPTGITILFAMNDLFELFVEKMLKRAFAGSDIEVIGQGGNLCCLGDWSPERGTIEGNAFRTRPDIILRRGASTIGIIDTKWKRLARPFVDRKKGVQQADVYQMMAYARTYWPPNECAQSKHGRRPRLMLLYPSVPTDERTNEIVHNFGIRQGPELLALGRLDVSQPPDQVKRVLKDLAAHLINT